MIHRIEEQIIEEAKKNAPFEICGLIIIKEYRLGIPVFDIIKMKNIAEKSAEYFELDVDIYKLYEKTKNIYAIYHSHGAKGYTEKFSSTDIKLAERLKIPIMVYCVETERFNWYKPFSIKSDYIGRSFLLGVRDCFSLARDYYYHELGIEVPDIYRFYSQKENLDLSQRLQEFGFVYVKEKNLQKHDVIVLYNSKFYSGKNFSVYLGNDKILSHSERVSKIEYLSSYATYKYDILRYAK